eukprot:COSAG04_NODE_327_length_16667_cov_12.707991_2_plen_147_part_00
MLTAARESQRELPPSASYKRVVAHAAAVELLEWLVEQERAGNIGGESAVGQPVAGQNGGAAAAAASSGRGRGRGGRKRTTGRGRGRGGKRGRKQARAARAPAPGAAAVADMEMEAAAGAAGAGQGVFDGSSDAVQTMLGLAGGAGR